MSVGCNTGYQSSNDHLTIYDLKNFQERDNLIVFGYINCFLADCLLIPKEIIFVCLDFYHPIEEWNVRFTSSSFRMYDNGIIKKLDDGYRSAYLSVIVNNKGIHSWTFKILQLGNIHQDNAIIGVMETTQNQTNSKTPSIFTFHNEGKSFIGTSGNICNHGAFFQYRSKGIKYGDIVEMTVDLKKYLLYFALNNQPQKEAFNLQDNLDYRAAITLCAIGDSIQLLSYRYRRK
eukprot:408866_1